MKKLLLATALITSLSSIAIAEVSISGEAKVNAKSGDYHIESDLTIIGKSGDTSVIAQLGLDNQNTVEQLYMTSKVAGIDVKAGVWKSGKGELGVSTTKGGWPRMRASTSFGGVKLVYQDMSGPAGTWVAVAGTIGGVKVMHKVKDTSNETKLSGSMGGVNLDYHGKRRDSSDDSDSITLKTSIQGIDLTYVETSAIAGTNMDGFIGKTTSWLVTEANAFGVSTNILGNKVTYKDISINGLDSKSLTLTRKIASGATFEATYRDVADGICASNGLDLELAVKF